MLVTYSEQKIGFFGRFIGEKMVFGRHGNDLDKKNWKKMNQEKSSIFPRKYEKIAFEGFQTYPKCLEVIPSNHQAIDYTYYI